MATKQALFLAYSDPSCGALREGDGRRLRLDGSNSNRPTQVGLKTREDNERVVAGGYGIFWV